jgi:hypothetical protein
MNPRRERCRPDRRIFLPALIFSPTRSPSVRGQACTGAGPCRISARIANENRGWAFCVRWEMAANDLWSVRFVWRNGSSGESSARMRRGEPREASRLHRGRTQARPRGSLRQLPELHQDRGHDQERAAPNRWWMRWRRSRSICGREKQGYMKLQRNLLQL